MFSQARVTGFYQKWLEHDLQRPPDEREAYEIAILNATLANKDEAMKWLERAYAAHASNLLFVKSEPAFDSLRSDPRFNDLIRRIGFPQ